MRKALQLAVDNAVVLQLGYGNAGTVGRNHHVCPIHPEYYELPKMPRDIAKAKKLMAEAGQADFEHELITVDEDWHKNTGDAIAAQLREAGIKVKRTVLPGSTFWNDWTKYPFSMTNWNMRPLGVQVLALAYRTGEAWNETAYVQPRLRRQAQRRAGRRRSRTKRKELMKDIEQILQDSGIIIQPYWQSLFSHMTPRSRITVFTRLSRWIFRKSGSRTADLMRRVWPDRPLRIRPAHGKWMPAGFLRFILSTQR